MSAASRKPMLMNVAWAAALGIVLTAAYVFSYAPVAKWTRNPNPFALVSDGSDLTVYKPADWLIDYSPARRAIFRWADLWGVGDDFRLNHLRRTKLSLSLLPSV